MKPVVIVGSGLAGVTVAREFRKLDSGTPLVIVTRDAGSVYSKPMLSNALAGGRSAGALATADAAALAAQIKGEVVAGREIASIDTAARSLRFADGGALDYGQLVLALGADPIRFAIDGDGADAVLTVNDLADYASFRAAIEAAGHITILGGGLIGCEFANDLLASSRRVAVVDPAAWPLSRLLPEAIGQAFRERLAAAGVDFRFGVTAARIDRSSTAGNGSGDSGHSLTVTLSNEETIATDAVLSAIGLAPRTSLAKAAGLTVKRGIVVDRQLRTSEAGIFALGDCAEVCGNVLPYVMPLMNAARALAKTLAGQPTDVVYPAMPVVVKTPAAPLTVCPPAIGAAGQWQTAQADGDSLEATFIGEGGQMLGFALLNVAPARRQALTKELPPLLA